MTSSGVPPTGAGGADEPDWLDAVLERAAQAPAGGDAGLPIVPEPEQASAPAVADPRRAVPPTAAHRPNTADKLGEIRWVEGPDVTPAGVPIAQPGAGALVPEAVGRSAWDDQLSTIGQEEPAGWDKLSWQDLDGAGEGPVVQQATTFGSLLREWGPVVFAAVAIALFSRLVLIQAYHIPSGSMIPTLEEGDRVVVNRLSYDVGEIQRGQVVVFDPPPLASGDNALIKRVIALPGEEVRLVDNQVYIDGLRVEEPYLREPDSTTVKGLIPNCEQPESARDRCVVPEGHVFVLGDNRQASSDGRVFGPVPVDSIVGRAFVRVWPFNNTGLL